MPNIIVKQAGGIRCLVPHLAPPKLARYPDLRLSILSVPSVRLQRFAHQIGLLTNADRNLMVYFGLSLIILFGKTILMHVNGP